MTTRYCLHPTCTIGPDGEGELMVRLPLFGRSIRADPYLIQLLGAFGDEGGAVSEAPALESHRAQEISEAAESEQGRTLDEVIARFPFRQEEARAFFARCVEAGFLVEPARRFLPPDRTGVEPRLANLPPFAAADAPAFTVVGVPWDGATTGLGGARFGPAQIRAAASGFSYQVDVTTRRPFGFADMGSGRRLLDGIRLADAGDVYVAPAEPLEQVFARVTRVVGTLLDAGTLPLVVGGDHSITHAVLRAYAEREMPLQVLHLDAHTDLGDALPGSRLHHGNVFEMVLQDFNDVEQLVQVGLRGIYDVDVLQPRTDVVQFGMDRFRQEGVPAVIDALDPLLPVYVSFDIDAVDPAYAPSTGTPVPGGFRPDEVKTLLRAVGERFEIIGADIVEVSMSLGPADGTSTTALESLLTLADAHVEGMRQRILAELPAEADSDDDAETVTSTKGATEG